MVLDIEKYPEFVPWCLGGKIHDKIDKGDIIEIKADLTIGKSFFRDTYKSFVIYNKSEDSIHETNIDGPLKHLENEWFFKQEGDSSEVEFNELGNIAKSKGFLLVSSSPLTRSSYHADEDFAKLQQNRINIH